MKNKFITVLSVLFLMLLICLMPNCFALEGDDIITFKDQNLKNNLINGSEWDPQAYDTNGDGEISVSEMENMYSVELKVFPTDFSPLLYATNLQYLSIQEVDIENLNGIEILVSLTNLENVSIGNCNVADVSALNNLTNITNLNIYGNSSLTDISGLKDLTNLKQFSITNTSVEDVSIVSNFTKLEELSLYGNKIKKIPDLSKIEKFSKQEESSYTSIYMANNEITDISGLKGTTFSSITLDTNKISDLSPLKEMSKLSYISLRNNNVESISDLPTTLTTVDLSSNQISDISHLGNLTNLQTIMLTSNQVSDISCLESLKETLMNLYLSSNKITDASVISKLTNLQYCDLSKNQLETLSISNLEKLYSIYCAENKLNSFTLENVPNISNINIQKNNISDISSLKNLEKASWLNLSTNPISDISPISSTNARYIYLVDTLVNPYNEATFHILCTLQENGQNVFLGDYSQFKPSNEEAFTTKEIEEVTVGDEKVTVMPTEKKTTVEDILTESNFPVIGTYTIKVLDANGNEKASDDKVGSRNVIQVTDEEGTVLAEYTVVVPGDVNGDGETRIYDSFQILKDVLITLGENIDAIEVMIRDFNKDGNVRIYDAFQYLKEAILG